MDDQLMEAIDRLGEELCPADAAWADWRILLRGLARTIGLGGKRLRPIFCLMGYRAGGGLADARIVRAGAAVELIHTAAIVHDDVLDRSLMRRGEPTLQRRLAWGRDPGFGGAAAVLVGDLAQALADRLLAESGFPPERILEAFGHFNRMRAEAVQGELMDLVLTAEAMPDERSVRAMAALKSGSYSVLGPLLMGASLGDAPPEVLRALARFGRPLGEAFQHHDDVESTFGDPVATGKDVDTDIREGKSTLLVAGALRLGSAPTRRLLRRRLGRQDLSPEEVDEVREAIRGCGALSATLEVIGSLLTEAKAEARVPPLPVAVADELRTLAVATVGADQSI